MSKRLIRYDNLEERETEKIGRGRGSRKLLMAFDIVNLFLGTNKFRDIVCNLNYNSWRCSSPRTDDRVQEEEEVELIKWGQPVKSCRWGVVTRLA